MNIPINNGITVNFALKAKISKSDSSLYHIYVVVKIYQHGVESASVSASSGITINKNQWSRGKVIGRGSKPTLINERLNDYLGTTRNLLYELSIKKVKTCTDLRNELEKHLKLHITGKPARGQKNEFISVLEHYSYQSVMRRLFEEKGISEGRKRGYFRSFNLLSEYFNETIPTIDQITTEELEQFKKWLHKQYRNQNTRTDYLSKIAAVIKYGVKLKIISSNPLPENFRGSFVDGNRKILAENECLKIMNIADNTLSDTQKVAKYCLLVQLLTGMGYSDMKDLAESNFKYEENMNQYFIEKQRNKTGITFKVFLTENALFMVNKLRELTGDNEKPFNIPSIDYSLRMYKEIGKLAALKTPITTYTLRHTFSVNYMENDGRIEDLSKILGHTNLETTQIYGKISNKRLANKMQLLQNVSKIHQIQQVKDQIKAV